MKANVILSVARFYDATKFDVYLGQVFDINLTEVAGNVPPEWFSNNDQVLSIVNSEDGKSARVTATSIGSCKIQLQTGTTTQKTLEVAVYGDEAASLAVTVGEVEPK